MTVAEDSTEEHSHHLPAVEDWPRGFGEASWWPFITAIGATGFYVGAALYIIGTGQNAIIDKTVGPIVFVASFLVFLTGLYGWLYHAFVKHYWKRGARTNSNLRWGMLLFLGTEITTFGAGFTYYFFVRAGEAWTRVHVPTGLVSKLVIANTIILLTSSVTLHFAHTSLRKGNRSRFVRLLITTFVLGVLFIAGQVYEYYHFVVNEGLTFGSGIFTSAFFGLTGLHGLHVTMGTILLGILSIRALKGQYSPERHTSISTVSMYWHFVDGVWIFLVVVLYVGASL